MRSTLIVSAFAALALAAPRPQEIEFDLVDAAPDPIVVTVPITGTSDSVPIQAAAAAAAIGTQAVDETTMTKRRSLFSKRDGDCSKQPLGTGPAVTSPADDAASFKANPAFSTNAQKYAQPANVPQGYSLAFSDLKGSTSTVSYLSYKTLSSYDPVACQQYCDSLEKCVAFNIYYERDPTVDPNTVNCPNPASLTNIKCVRWGVKIDGTSANNVGQFRASFEVVIAGSNGYNKLAGPPAQTGYSGPVALGGAINAPNDPVTNTNTYTGYKFFSIGTGTGQVQSYNDGVVACLAAAQAQEAYNGRHPPASGNPAKSNFIVTYVLSMNNTPQGIYCPIYTEAWDGRYATNTGQNRGTDVYTVSQAYAYTANSYTTANPAWTPICAVGGCAAGSYQGGNCGGWGAGTCTTVPK